MNKVIASLATSGLLLVSLPAVSQAAPVRDNLTIKIVNSRTDTTKCVVSGSGSGLLAIGSDSFRREVYLKNPSSGVSIFLDDVNDDGSIIIDPITVDKATFNKTQSLIVDSNSGSDLLDSNTAQASYSITNRCRAARG